MNIKLIPSLTTGKNYHPLSAAPNYQFNIQSIDNMVISPEYSKKKFDNLNHSKDISVTIPGSTNSSPSSKTRNDSLNKYRSMMSTFFTMKDKFQVLTGDNCIPLQNNTDSVQPGPNNVATVQVTTKEHEIETLNTYNMVFSNQALVKLSSVLEESDNAKRKYLWNKLHKWLHYNHFVSPCVIARCDEKQTCDNNQPCNNNNWCSYNRTSSPKVQHIIQKGSRFAVVASPETNLELRVSPSNEGYLGNSAMTEIDVEKLGGNIECGPYPKELLGVQLGSHPMITSNHPVLIVGELIFGKPPSNTQIDESFTGEPIFTNQSGTYLPSQELTEENIKYIPTLKGLKFVPYHKDPE